MDDLGLPRSNVLGYTLPGFATSTRTLRNAHRLMAALGVTATEIDIRPSATQMLHDLDHPAATGEPVYDLTYENVQAGARTSLLFRLANLHDGLVVGTGDLSELALGWCTYGVGDQMSHYGVNGSVPKTLIQYLIRWVAGNDPAVADAREALESIVGDDHLTGAGPPNRWRRRTGRARPAQRRRRRPLRAPGLPPLLHAPIRVPPVEDRVPRAARLGRPRAGAVARAAGSHQAQRIRPAHDLPLAP